MTLLLAALAVATQAPAPLPLAPSAGVGVAFIATGDLCGGPGDEIFVGRNHGGYSIVRIDEPSGRWEVQPVPIAPGPGFSEGQVAAADVDGDGRVDLLHDNGVVFNGTPAGSSRFEGVDVPGPFHGAAVSRLVGVPDVDGDGLGDPVFLDDTSGAQTRPLMIARQLSPRVLAAPQPFAMAPLRAATVLDADGDGDLDIAVVTEDLRLQVWESGAPSATPVVAFDAQLPPPPFAPGVYDLVAADLDDDGVTDLVVAGSEVMVFLGLGAATFAPVGSTAPIGWVGDAALVDVDGDGDRDLVIHPETLEWYLGGWIFWIERTDPLGFEGPARLLTPTVGFGFGEAVAADLDGDGVDELAAALDFGNLGTVDLPTSVDSLAGFTPVRSGPPPGPATAALDLDGDGDRDIVAGGLGALITLETVATGEMRQRVRLEGEGPGAALVSGASGGPSAEPWIATIRSDGVLTVVRDLTEESGPAVEELGAGYVSGLDQALATLDQDGDGDDDVLAIPAFGAAIDVVRQGAPGLFEAPEVVAQASSGSRFEAVIACEWDGVAPADVVVVEVANSGTSLRLLRGAPTGYLDAGPGQTVAGSLRKLRVAATPGRPMSVFAAVGAEVMRYETRTAGTLAAPATVLNAFPWQVVDFRVDATAAVAPFGRIVTVERQGPQARVTAYPLGGAGSIEVLGPAPETASTTGLEDFDGDGALDLLLSTPEGLWWARARDDAADLAPYCAQSEVNSLGLGARLRARTGAGQASGAASTLRLDAVDLPPGATTLFLTGRGVAALPGAGGALGTLCLGGTLGRFVAPGQVLTANAGGAAGQDVDPLALPSGGQLLPVAAGDVWAFQGWYRDVDAAGNPVSRLTDAVLATF